MLTTKTKSLYLLLVALLGVTVAPTIYGMNKDDRTNGINERFKEMVKQIKGIDVTTSKLIELNRTDMSNLIERNIDLKNFAKGFLFGVIGSFKFIKNKIITGLTFGVISAAFITVPIDDNSDAQNKTKKMNDVSKRNYLAFKANVLGYCFGMIVVNLCTYIEQLSTKKLNG